MGSVLPGSWDTGRHPTAPARRVLLWTCWTEPCDRHLRLHFPMAAPEPRARAQPLTWAGASGWLGVRTWPLGSQPVTEALQGRRRPRHMCVSPPSTLHVPPASRGSSCGSRSQCPCWMQQGHCSFSHSSCRGQASRVPPGSLPAPPPGALGLQTPHLVLLGGTHTVPRLVSWWPYRHRCPRRRGRAF